MHAHSWKPGLSTDVFGLRAHGSALERRQVRIFDETIRRLPSLGWEVSVAHTGNAFGFDKQRHVLFEIGLPGGKKQKLLDARVEVITLPVMGPQATFTAPLPLDHDGPLHGERGNGVDDEDEEDDEDEDDEVPAWPPLTTKRLRESPGAALDAPPAMVASLPHLVGGAVGLTGGPPRRALAAWLDRARLTISSRNFDVVSPNIQGGVHTTTTATTTTTSAAAEQPPQQPPPLPPFPPSHPPSLCAPLRSPKVVFTELGMDLPSYLLAHSRLVAVGEGAQLVAWGHPVTSGLPRGLLDGWVAHDAAVGFGVGVGDGGGGGGGGGGAARGCWASAAATWWRQPFTVAPAPAALRLLESGNHRHSHNDDQADTDDDDDDDDDGGGGGGDGARACEDISAARQVLAAEYGEKLLMLPAGADREFRLSHVHVRAEDGENVLEGRG